MSAVITAPVLAEALAKEKARSTTPTNQPVGIPLTRKQMLDWDEKSLRAGGWL